MPTQLEKELDKPCDRCGMRGIWICSDRQCPRSGHQKEARDKWQELGRNPEGEESGN